MNKDRQIGVVKETKDYFKFKKFNGNRDLSEKSIKFIETSISISGWKPEPILVNEHYEVCDGQHRLEVAKRHNLPIPYLVINGLTPDDCVRINAKRRNWTSADYIQHWADLGNDSYKYLEKIKNTIGKNFNYQIILYAIAGTDSVFGKDRKVSLADGNVKITEEQYQKAFYKLQFLDDLLPYIKQVKGNKTNLQKAILLAYDYKDINNERLSKVIKEGYKKIIAPTSIEFGVEQIEELYNYHLVNKVWFLRYYKENRSKK